MTYDKEKFLTSDLAKAKSEVQKMVHAETVSGAVAEIKNISNLLKKDRLKAMELVFHGVKELSSKLETRDIPDLLALVRNVEYPHVGGEERAAYFNTIRLIFNKISALTGIDVQDTFAPRPEEINQAVQSVQTWYDNNQTDA